MEKTLELEIRTILPGIDNDEDHCISRLETVLQNNPKMQKAHIKQGDGKTMLCLHYEPDAISLTEVKRTAERAGLEIVNRYHHAVIPVNNLDCSDCVLVIEHTLNRMDGVLDARVNYAAKKIWVEFDTHTVDLYHIKKRVISLGYEIPLAGQKKWLAENREILFSLLAGLLVLIGWAGGRFAGFQPLVSTILYLTAYVVGGWDIAHHAWHALKERYFDTDFLMVMAAIGAAVLGDFAEGALLIFLFSLGHALEEKALDRARSAITALADLTPKTALVRRGETEVEVPVEDLQLQDTVIIKPGARIPIDGQVISGFSSVNQAPVTGESVPVEKSTGSKVFAGTINGEGALEIQVTRLAEDSTLSRVMKMVEEAEGQKSPTQQLMERFERVFVPVVLIVTVLTITIPPLFGFPFHESFLRAMTLLIAASPCALALGTPAAILAGIGQAARNGVLVKGGNHLENLGLLKAVAFDKTGTITQGRLELTDVIAFQGYSKETVLSIASSIESRSGHPLAQAVVRAASGKNIPQVALGQVESLTGLGMRSTYENREVLVGNLRLLDDQHIRVSQEIQDQITSLENGGKTTVTVLVDRQVVGLLALADTMRSDVSTVIKNLKKLGLQKTAILTGDNQRVADAIARQAGVDEVYANLMPEDKLKAVQSLVASYENVAMIGDGVNDAPALAYATVGIAMGGAGTDVALETADVALMSDNLQKLPFAIGLGRATRRIIIQNLTIAIGVIVMLVITSLTGWIGIGVAIIFHEGSTLVVVANALRLLAYQQTA
jgi:Cd2+/Zn2+-exporting ATPase